MARFMVVKAFEIFAQQFVIEEREDTLGSPGEFKNLILIHTQCGEDVCRVEDCDTMADLIVTINNHEC
jgi:hypothetical protein